MKKSLKFFVSICLVGIANLQVAQAQTQDTTICISDNEYKVIHALVGERPFRYAVHVEIASKREIDRRGVYVESLLEKQKKWVGRQWKVFDLDTIVSAEDIRYILSQLNSYPDGKKFLTPELVRYRIPFYDPRVQEKINEKEVDGLIKISKPLLSKNGRAAFIYSEFICNDCASAHLYLLRKDDKGQWSVFGNEMLWIE